MTEQEWSDVLVKATRLDGLIQRSQREMQEYQQISTALQEVEKRRDNLKSTIDRCTTIYKDVQQNLAEKKKYSQDRYLKAIEQASNVVRNSDIAGANLKIDKDRAVIVDTRGHSINVREGSALRSVAGMLLRYTSITAQMNYLPLILLDESFFTLSDNTSNEMKEYLQAFAEDLLIIGIEQRDTIFAGIPGVIRYEFVKHGDKKTKIRKETEEVESGD